MSSSENPDADDSEHKADFPILSLNWLFDFSRLIGMSFEGIERWVCRESYGDGYNEMQPL